MRGQQKTAAKRAVILKAAAELFTGKDFHLVLMDEVAVRAGVGKGTLYRYFPTKEDLYFATIFEGWERLREELEEVLREEGPLEEMLEKATRQILSYFWQRRHFVTLVHRLEHNTSGTVQADWQRKRESIVRLVERVLKKGNRSGAFPSGNLRLLTEMFLGMVRSIVLYRGSRDTPAALAPLAVNLFLHGLHNNVRPNTIAGLQTLLGSKDHERTTTLL
jgi:AcrR family transcriptional regulator